MRTFTTVLRWLPAFVGLSVAAVGGTVFAAEAVAIRSITVSGMAERKVAPDEARVNITIAATNMKLETAKADHDKKLRTVMAIAKKAGIDDAQMKTQNSSVQPQYTYENNKRNFKGYVVQTNLEITVKKIDAVGGLLEKLASAGLESGDTQEWGNLINVNYQLANPDKIRDEMLTDAIRNARAKAEKMVVAANASIGAVIQINEGGAPQFNFPSRPMPMMAMAKSMSADEAAPAPPVGEQQVNANVTVIFELK